jgi:hypothetical protein
MYKKQSENFQSRTTRQAIHSRYNEHGIDPTAFSEHPHPNPDEAHIDKIDLAKLRRDKREVEVQLSLINSRLIEGRTALKRGSMRETSFDQVSQWEKQRANLIRKMAAMDRLLMQAKIDRVAEQSQQDDQRYEQQAVVDQFPQIFMAMAKELLAHEVYNRIFIATVHRQREK